MQVALEASQGPWLQWCTPATSWHILSFDNQSLKMSTGKYYWLPDHGTLWQTQDLNRYWLHGFYWDSEQRNLKLHHIVISCMVQGPCGEWSNASPCMAKQMCKKDYPSFLCDKTSFCKNSCPHYRRVLPSWIPLEVTSTYQAMNGFCKTSYMFYSDMKCHINMEILCIVLLVITGQKYSHQSLKRKHKDWCSMPSDHLCPWYPSTSQNSQANITVSDAINPEEKGIEPT